MKIAFTPVVYEHAARFVGRSLWTVSRDPELMFEGHRRAFIDHLNANEVDVSRTPTVVGPTLTLVSGRESFVTKDKFDAGYWANTMLRRDYRPPFTVPAEV